MMFDKWISTVDARAMLGIGESKFDALWAAMTGPGGILPEDAAGTVSKNKAAALARSVAFNRVKLDVGNGVTADVALGSFKKERSRSRLRAAVASVLALAALAVVALLVVSWSQSDAGDNVSPRLASLESRTTRIEQNLIDPDDAHKLVGALAGIEQKFVKLGSRLDALEKRPVGLDQSQVESKVAASLAAAKQYTDDRLQASMQQLINKIEQMQAMRSANQEESPKPAARDRSDAPQGAPLPAPRSAGRRSARPVPGAPAPKQEDSRSQPPVDTDDYATIEELDAVADLNLRQEERLASHEGRIAILECEGDKGPLLHPVAPRWTPPCPPTGMTESEKNFEFAFRTWAKGARHWKVALHRIATEYRAFQMCSGENHEPTVVERFVAMVMDLACSPRYAHIEFDRQAFCNWLKNYYKTSARG